MCRCSIYDFSVLLDLLPTNIARDLGIIVVVKVVTDAVSMNSIVFVYVLSMESTVFRNTVTMDITVFIDRAGG